MRKLYPSFNTRVSKFWNDSSKISSEEVIYPIFVCKDKNQVGLIPNFPNIKKITSNMIQEYLEPLVNIGLKSILLFGSINDDLKDDKGSFADDESGPVIQAIYELKKHFPHLHIITDVCLCAYTSEGTCGILKKGKIHNISSTQRLAQISKNYALAGAHTVAPSDMLDNRVDSINKILIEKDLRDDVSIMSYSAKFSSALYGPFRHACNSSFSPLSKRVNQLPIGSSNLASRAILRDIKEGADFIIVKPGITNLDIIYKAANFDAPNHPIIAYQVSGEYSMIYNAAKEGYLNLDETIIETIYSFKRAGCKAVITYFTPQILELIKESS